MFRLSFKGKLFSGSAIAFPTIRPLVTLALFLKVACVPADAIASEEAIAPKRFVDWCLNKAKLTSDTKHTVDVLLQAAKTQNCKLADNKLSTFTTLNLKNHQIADLKPLSSLTKLTTLYLSNNRIADLKPLSSLTNLTYLDLRNNQIADLKSLSSITNLTYLDLSNNPIADLKPLSSITNLIDLGLEDNKIADLKPLSSLTNLTKLLRSLIV